MFHEFRLKKNTQVIIDTTEKFANYLYNNEDIELSINKDIYLVICSDFRRSAFFISNMLT